MFVRTLSPIIGYYVNDQVNELQTLWLKFNDLWGSQTLSLPMPDHFMVHVIILRCFFSWSLQKLQVKIIHLLKYLLFSNLPCLYNINRVLFLMFSLIPIFSFNNCVPLIIIFIFAIFNNQLYFAINIDDGNYVRRSQITCYIMRYIKFVKHNFATRHNNWFCFFWNLTNLCRISFMTWKKGQTRKQHNYRHRQIPSKFSYIDILEEFVSQCRWEQYW